MGLGLSRENSSVPAILRAKGNYVADSMFAALKRVGGATVELSTLTSPAKTDGYFVGGATGWNDRQIKTQTFASHTFTNRTMRRMLGFMYTEHLTLEEVENGVKPEQCYMGVWLDPETATVHVDAVTWIADRDAAVALGRRRGELAVYDVEADGSLYVVDYVLALTA